VADAIAAGKHVFVEKPLCLTLEELNQIETAYLRAGDPAPLLMVGFNRRFAPQVTRVKDLLGGVKEPKSFVMTVNAGAIPKDHWTQDNTVGGGRILGEACHFIDLLRFLAGAPVVRHSAVALGRHPGSAVTSDKATIILEFEGGSVGTIHYLANGNRAFPKERLEVFCVGRILQLDNFRRMRGWGWKGFSRMNLWRQNKGNAAGVSAFVDAVRNGQPSPIPPQEIFDVSRVAIEVANSLR
jgi:predicted dehydrogenase